MKSHYKPTDYTSVSPYFIVQGAQKLIDLLQKIFGVQALRRYENSDGSIRHAEIRLDDTVLMIGDAGEAFTPNSYWMHVYVPDVFATFQKALEAGCISVEEPKQREADPDIRGTFQDFAGNNWSVATQGK
jgi:PhnB protein